MISRLMFAGSAIGMVCSIHSLAAAEAGPRQRISFNDDWRFQKGDPASVKEDLSYDKLKPWMLPTSNAFRATDKFERPEGDAPGEKLDVVGKGYNDLDWKKLSLPHDWAIEGPFDIKLPGESGKLPWPGIGWYRKSFSLPAADKGKSISLEIDGAMAYSTIWCNGKLVGGWPYGYSSYRVDLTPFLNYGGENTIAIRLNNPEESSRWYPGSGIYRNVWLTKTSTVHVENWGTFVTTPQVSDAEATVEISTRLANESSAVAGAQVLTEIYELGASGPKGAALSKDVTVVKDLAAGASTELKATLKISNPKRWDVSSPNRYIAVTTVKSGDQIVDRYETKFGVRTIAFTSNDGFHLNGKRLQIRGVCLHHDFGALGAAFNLRAAQRQLEMMREMGCNAIRTSHNPPAPELLELCDSMGFVVLDELTDTWTRAKKPYGYAVLFQDWSEADLRALIRRDRNHPSIILWSTGNEIGEQENEKFFPISVRLSEIVRSEDKTRLVTAACDRPAGGLNGFQKTVDVFGYNYKPMLYTKFRETNPDQPLYGSETSSCISSRGEYLFPVGNKKDGGILGFHVSSYDLYAPPWAMPPDDEFKGQEQHPDVAGEFVWTGFDYIGEPTPFNQDLTILTNFHDPVEKAKAEEELKKLGAITPPSRSSYFGIIDLAGFKKDRFYIYQAHWRPELPMVHILPHWNWPDRVGQVTPVHVYTSGDEAELFINGKSQGRKKKEKFQYRLRWDDVVYQPGEVKVVAYKDGKKWAESTVKTTGDASQLKLTPDRATIKGDGKDISYVTCAVADKAGLMVPRANVGIKFTIQGPGEIVATDNGDPTDLNAFPSHDRKSFNGLAMAIVKAKPGAKGEITVKAEANGLTLGVTKIKAAQ
jgi:beta-galactosidase